jgi:hypothetical protein
MKEIPEIGAKVKYTGESDMFKGARGVVTQIFHPWDDEEVSVGVEVEGELPKYWPYLDRRGFAPALEEIEAQ